MQSHSPSGILLGAFCLCVALATLMNKNAHGARTCPRLCMRITECSCYLYLTSDTTCPPRLVKSGEAAGISLNCSQSGRIQSIMQCKPSLEKLTPLNSKAEWDEKETKKLLMLPYSNKLLKGRQLLLNNYSSFVYPFLQTRHVETLAYISSLRKVVVFTYDLNELFISPLNDRKKRVVKTGIFVRHLAVDDNRGIVFMTRYLPYSVSRMTTEGDNFTSIGTWTSASIPRKVVADPKRSLIYVLCFNGKILKLTYHGSSRGALTGRPRSSVLDISGDLLYFFKNDYSHLFAMSLSDNSMRKVGRFGFSVRQTVTDGNVMYVMPNPFKGDVLVFDLSNFRSIKKVNTGFDKDVRCVNMCLIT